MTDNIGLLGEAFRRTIADHPVARDAIVVLPDHLHCLWWMPEGDDNYASRRRMIKARFSEALAKGERRSASRMRKGERSIRQRRYWEHLIRDEDDYARHLDCIHYNPVKHGYAARAKDWPYSSFIRWVEKGVYADDWGAGG